MSREGILDGSNLLHGAGSHDPPAAGPSLRTEVDDVIGRLDHIDVVLDDDNGVSISTSRISTSGAFVYRRVETDRRFVQDVKGIAVCLFTQFPRKLDPLSLPPDRVVADCPSLI